MTEIECFYGVRYTRGERKKVEALTDEGNAIHNERTEALDQVYATHGSSDNMTLQLALGEAARPYNVKLAKIKGKIDAFDRWV